MNSRFLFPILFCMVCAPSLSAFHPSQDALAPAQKESLTLIECRERIAELSANPSQPQFQLHKICDERVVVIAPKGHDLLFAMASTKSRPSGRKVSLESALNQIFDWLACDYMTPQPTMKPMASPASAKPIEPIFILVVDKLLDRELFNMMPRDGLHLINRLIYTPLKPYNHEACIGEPNSYPGSCGDVTSCDWEAFVPLSNLVSRVAEQLLKDQFGAIPPVFLGFREILEVAFSGGHFCFARRGSRVGVIPSNYHIGYALEFRILQSNLGKKKSVITNKLHELLRQESLGIDLVALSWNWGIAQKLLETRKWQNSKKGSRNLGDFLLECAQMPDPSPDHLMEALLRYDPKFVKNFHKRVSQKHKDLDFLLKEVKHK